MSTEQRPDQSQFDSAKDPRRGMAPFAEGIKRGKVLLVDVIESKPIPFGDFGDLSLVLYRSTVPEYMFKQDLENERAFSIDITGKISRGQLRRFTEKGYYQVAISVRPYKGQVGKEEVNASIWIDNTVPHITTEFSADYNDDTDEALFNWLDPTTGVMESLVLPGDEEILRAIRINVNSN